MSRPGAALLELVTASLLLGIVCVLAAALMHAEATIIRNTSEHTAIDEALRTTRTIMTSELRSLRTNDIHAIARDSVRMRVFRGWGIVCATSDERVTLRYSGLRQPDATKDSLLVFGEDRIGTFRHSDLPGDGCAAQAGEELLALAPSMPVGRGQIVMIFETGSYLLALHALRYRRGAEGRQPLTDELLDETRSRFVMDSNGRGIRLTIRSVPEPDPAGRQSDSRVRLLNQEP